jgi:hypothetical protein
MAMKMVANMKVSVLKEFAEKLEKSELMSDELKEIFEKQYEEWKEQSKHITKILNKMNNKKKKNNTTSDEESDESNNTNNVKKEKRNPTEHQARVSKCMNLLKEKYPDVKHQIRLGTANYMATYIKNEFQDMDFETEPEKVEQAMQHATKRMNDKKGEDIFTESPLVEKKEEEKKDTTDDENPAEEKNMKKNKKTKK